MRQIFVAATATTLAVVFAMPASAGPYDKEWTDRCIRDNKDEGQTSQTVAIYCTCMVALMPESETRSVTQWEKSNKQAENRCSAQAGWKGR